MLALAVLAPFGIVNTSANGEAGRLAAADVARDEALWGIYRRLRPEEAAAMEHKGLVPIAEALPPDVIEELDRHFVPQEVRI
jgi:manganese/zinc/iron transport system permease protein